MLLEDDPTFKDFKKEFDDCYAATKMNIEELKTKSEKFKNDCNANKNQFNSIQKIDPDVMDYQFGKKISEWLKGTDEKVEKVKENMVLVQDSYNKTLDLFLVEKNDEIITRQKSEKLFIFWTNYFNQVHACFPEEKKPGRGTGPIKKNAQQIAMMAELAAKMKK